MIVLMGGTATVYMDNYGDTILRRFEDEDGVQAVWIEIDPDDTDLLERFIRSEYEGWEIICATDDGLADCFESGETVECPETMRIDTIPYWGEEDSSESYDVHDEDEDEEEEDDEEEERQDEPGV